ncbi:MmgE/PrpD family protein [Aeromicrobium chenweiae]|uniref:MmgE/PrpD family protein n=1 Tax=Aeromicrobium chenweiae TaxID=2079793 RepID=A0A2S0WRG2_9ACTN|nr:MmgE/PrpD family protein [Aeromicrobium chenweiae]AWB93824.1 MmgE/PrpD family protein [Aeromicrobium chenweiae]TGN30869.1 MmgE/PrpD family protein [Aeromicrobium chenweiae]
MTAVSLTEDLISRARALHGAVPDDVMTSARLHLLDALGVGALGARRGPLKGFSRLAAGGQGPSSVLGTSGGAPAPVAALVNGAYIHSLEYDDTHVASVMHGSATLAPAALAVAQETGADGAAMLSAYALAWEVLIRMGQASPGTLQARGFQTTSTAGPFAAALVSTLLHGDDPELALHALGIAGSQPGGTFAFLDEGSTVKAGQPAWAAHSGIWAAEMARAGMTGPSRVLEGERGFFQLYADDAGAPDRLRDELATLGERWHLPDAAFKLIPCCHFIHPFVEALGLVLDDGIEAGQIARIHCHVPRGAVPVIAEPWADRQTPRTPHDGRWSLPYVLAGRAVDGRVDLDLFDTPVGGDRLDLSRRISYEVWEDSGFPARFPARVEVTLTDGRVIESSVDDVIGGAGRPVEATAVRAKARANLLAAGLDEDAAARLERELIDEPTPRPGLVGEILAGAAG